MCFRCKNSAHASALGDDPFAATVDVYLRNLLAGTGLLLGKARGGHALESMPLLVTLAERGGRAPKGGWKDASIRRRLRAVVADTKPAAPPEPAAPLGAGIEVLASLMRLSEVERRIITFLLALQNGDELAQVLRAYGEVSLAAASRLIAVAVARSPDEVARALAPRAHLVVTGLVRPDIDVEDLPEKFDLKHGLLELVSTPGLDRDQIITRFLPESAAATLALPDFERVRSEAFLVRDILAAALRERRRGVNILLYGPSGTGKTELVRLLAREAGAKLYLAGKEDENQASPSVSDRLASLRLGNQLLRSSASVMIFDEIEDIFDWRNGLDGRAEPCMSKMWFNTLLETNPVPTVWVTNQVVGIDPAFLRRFCFAIEIKSPGARERERILRGHLGCESTVDAYAVARRFESSPARIGAAVAMARLVGRVDRETIEAVLAPVEKLVGREARLAAPFDPEAFRVDVLNADADLAGIAERLSAWKPDGSPGVSVCLWGPPGTGKSEFAKWLAWRMDRRVVMRRASDIQSKWVGETERNIAQAFAEAADEDALLLFDEADSFLRDRAWARASWEVSFVNEFLQQLEAFPGVVVCTTNLWRDLDAASLRRFTLKVELRPMTPEQAEALYRATFGEDAPAALARLSLTPGDFTAAARRRRFAGGAPLDLLTTEVKAKRDPGRRLGY